MATSLLARYEAATTLTRRMLDAARRQDWDDLADAGSARDAIFASLPANLPPMPTDEGRQMARLIGEMLTSHQEIAERAGPWLEHVARMLTALESAGSTSPPPSATPSPDNP